MQEGMSKLCDAAKLYSANHSINSDQNSIYKLHKSLKITWLTSLSQHTPQSEEA
jgi:hypothetical protein